MSAMFCRRSKPLVAALLVALGLGGIDTAFANTYIVNTAADPGPPGTLSLRQAITQANAGFSDTVQFAPALMGSTITLLNGEISITADVTIEGPGAGQLTISGYASRIFNVSAPGPATARIYGLTLSNGTALTGGAIYVHGGAALYLRDSVVTGSSDYLAGGGGISVVGGGVTISKSSIRGNSSASAGGGIGALDAYVSVRYSTISGNSASTYGGGIDLSGNSYGNIRYSLIANNRGAQAEGAYEGGAGIAVRTVYNSSLVGLAMYNSTVTGNYALYGGGGGIGVFRQFPAYDPPHYPSVFLDHCTIVGNGAQGISSGIGLFVDSGLVSVRKSIVANNFDFVSSQDLSGAVYAEGSLIRNIDGATFTDGGGNVFGVDPLLGRLTDNGGLTLSMLPAVDSFALDRIVCTSAVPIDQRGFPRCINGLSDMGAVERQSLEIADDRIFANGFEPP